MAVKFGIIGAMNEEVQEYLEQLTDLKEEKWKIFTFYTGNWYNHEVVIVKSGVGKVFASMICQKLIDSYNVDLVLFTGVGGSLNRDLDIGDVVIGIDSVHHDFNAVPLGFERGQISYTDYRFFEAEKEIIDLAKNADISPHKITQGRILTGDQFFTDADKKKSSYLTEELKGDCIEMEGAAVAQVCNINEVPHLIIRTVSDKADGSAVTDYNAFKHIIAKNSFQVVDLIIKKYS